MTDKFIFNDAQSVKAEIAKLISSYPELQDDDELKMDMIEGETDLLKLLVKALNARQEANMMAEAVGVREEAMKARRQRFERQADYYKRVLQMLVEATGQEKIQLPEATLSLMTPRYSVNVTDINELPQGFFALERKADKVAIKGALMNGEKIPGAEIVQGDGGLMIRTK